MEGRGGGDGGHNHRDSESTRGRHASGRHAGSGSTQEVSSLGSGSNEFRLHGVTSDDPGRTEIGEGGWGRLTASRGHDWGVDEGDDEAEAEGEGEGATSAGASYGEDGFEDEDED